MKNNEDENSVRSLGCSALMELLNNNELYENNEESCDVSSSNKNYVKEINLFEINNSLENDSIDKKKICYSTRLLNKSSYSKLSEKKIDLINYNLSFNNNIKTDCFKNTYFDTVDKYNLFLSSKGKYKYKNNNNNYYKDYKCLMPYNNKNEIKRDKKNKKNRKNVDLNFFSSQEDINTYTSLRKKKKRNSEIVKNLSAPNKDENISDIEENKLKKRKRKHSYEKNIYANNYMFNNTYEKNNIKLCNLSNKKRTSHNMLCDYIKSPDGIKNFVNKNVKDKIFIKNEVCDKNQNVVDIEICDNEKINKNNINNINIMNNISTNKYNNIINEQNKKKLKIYDKGNVLCPHSIDDNKKWNDNINIENIKYIEIDIYDKNDKYDKNVENFVFLDFIPMTEEYLKIKETINNFKNRKLQDNNTLCKKEDNVYIYSIPKSNLKINAIKKEYEKDMENDIDKNKKTYNNSEQSYIKRTYKDLKKNILSKNIKIINYDYEKNLCYILIRKNSTS
ncbi:hypothetical protein PGSY75_1144800 [Plasmodium gaboni]|uniref:Uncharacterized protein n=1 Tax=Plasmodium gaboni TaxID=647221 RepID=A0A151LJF8_9APIC|nr:hypothetical protein PGSY75_1144800 [Plasmodium gaboni]KYN99081.1 hypothetical protein PGSY75_1144800 [Plasmodium gaboni]